MGGGVNQGFNAPANALDPVDFRSRLGRDFSPMRSNMGFTSTANLYASAGHPLQRPQPALSPRYETSQSSLYVSGSLQPPAMTLTPVATAEQVLSRPTQVEALYDFVPERKGDLALTKGDLIDVVQWDGNRWWTGRCNGRVGRFPLNFVRDFRVGARPLLRDQEGRGDIVAQPVISRRGDRPNAAMFGPASPDVPTEHDRPVPMPKSPLSRR